MADPLARLKRAGVAKRTAEERFRRALVAAVESGASNAEIGRALGMTRAGARWHVERLTHRPS